MKFYLIFPNKEESSIFADISLKKIRYRVTTGLIIPTKAWNEKSQKVTNKESFYLKYNNQLAKIRAQIDDLIADFKISRQMISKVEFEAEIDKIIKPLKIIEQEANPIDNESISLTFISAFDLFIEDRIQSGAFAPVTIGKYKTVKKHLVNFSNYSKIPLSFENIDQNFYDKLLAYLRTKLNMCDNTIGSIVKNLKVFLFFSLQKGWTENRKFTEKGAFKVFKEDADTIALEIDEVKKIEIAELPAKLEVTRDLFLLQISTMLRKSDLFNLKEVNIDKNKKEIKLYQQKTKKMLRIPLTNKGLIILEKYNYSIPNVLHNYNESIKKVCKIAGIDQPIQIVNFVGNKRSEKTVCKYELISSHTARRTGITILLIEGKPPELIMKISGHYDIRSFQKYVRIAQDSAIESVRDTFNELDF